MTSPPTSSSPVLSDSDYERVTEQQPSSSPSERPAPSTDPPPCSSPVSFQQPWTSSPARPLSQSPHPTTNPYDLPLASSYGPQYSSPSPVRRPWSHPTPYHPWAGIPSSYVSGGRAITTYGGGGFIPPSQLHIPHHLLQSYPPPWAPGYPPHSSFYSIGFPPPQATTSSRFTGTRRPHDSIDDGWTQSGDDERAAPRRKVDLSAESGEEDDGNAEPSHPQGSSDEAVTHESDVVPQQLGAQSHGQASKKPSGSGLKRGVEVPNPYNIPLLGDVKPFVSKLHFLLSNPDQFGDVICWDTTGTRIMIKMKDLRLAREVLPRTFGHNKPASLARQFSVYNFTVMRILKDDTAPAPLPSVSALLPSSAAQSSNDWRVYQRSDTFFTRGTFKDIEVLKSLNPKESNRTSAGSSKSKGKKKKRDDGSSSDSD